MPIIAMLPLLPFLIADLPVTDAYSPYVMIGASIICLAFWGCVIFSMVTRTDLNGVVKLLWLNIVIFVPIFCYLFYWLIGPGASDSKDIQTQARYLRH
jgi:hypothetical protein